tara:strand:+ start:2836 stop:3345 length:510 start_codon:yes stop_codon:yes gene_type:complete
MSKKKQNNLNFNIGDTVVYPSHGVGQINSIDKIQIGEVKSKCLSIIMEQDNLTVSIPIEKISEVGLRKLSSRKNMLNALNLLKGKARVRRMMWSRKAQEYLNKINSGDPILISEVIRDLYKKNNQPEPSYSERQMFQSAIERLARELAAVEKIDHFSATEKIELILKSK